MIRIKKTTIKKHRLSLAAMLFAILLTGCASNTASAPGAPITPPGMEVNTYALPAEEMRIYYLDIGQGDATLLVNDGKAMLIDAGENAYGTDLQLYLDRYGIKELEYLVMTHPDSDHIGGADQVLYKCRVNTVFGTDYAKQNSTVADVEKAIEENGLQITVPKIGSTYMLGDASFTFLGPVKAYDNVNESSLVLLVTKGDKRFLFTGDAGKEAESDLVEAGTLSKVDVFQAGHHGSRKSNSEKLLETIKPKYAVISCGEENEYGYPHEQTLERFGQNKTTVYRTDLQGVIAVTCDGTGVSFAQEKIQLTIPDSYYIANKNSGVLHRATCDKLPASENSILFSTQAEATDRGFEKTCGNCMK